VLLYLLLQVKQYFNTILLANGIRKLADYKAFLRSMVADRNQFRKTSDLNEYIFDRSFPKLILENVMRLSSYVSNVKYTEKPVYRLQ